MPSGVFKSGAALCERVALSDPDARALARAAADVASAAAFGPLDGTAVGETVVEAMERLSAFGQGQRPRYAQLCTDLFIVEAGVDTALRLKPKDLLALSDWERFYNPTIAAIEARLRRNRVAAFGLAVVSVSALAGLVALTRPR